MYITYESIHHSSYGNRGRRGGRRHAKFSLPPRRLPSILPKTDFMPSKLVRISDMAVVEGSQVNDGYCALSYSWSQSGEVVFDEVTGKAELIDDGYHQIIYYDDLFPDQIIPLYKSYSSEYLRKIYEVFMIMEYNGYFFTRSFEYVKFGGIIQHVCQQFNIKYIWVDQMCINQDNKEEKHREIRNMHLIYDNAFCTVALAPDFNYSDGLLADNEYFKRLWTLEEAIKSKRILFVGSDTHKWSEEEAISKFSPAYQLVMSLSKINLAQILFHAHQRSSTKDHDRVFALIHLFPDLMQHVTIDYDQPLEDLMIQFYGLLAKKDLRILFFRKIEKEFRVYNSVIQHYKFLPSWTGFNGQHVEYDATATPFQNYDIIGKTMHVTSEFITNDQSTPNDALLIRKEDLPESPDNVEDTNDEYQGHRLCVLTQPPGASEKRLIMVAPQRNEYTRIFSEDCFEEISKSLQQISRFFKITKEDLVWCHSGSLDYLDAADIDCRDLSDDLDDSSAQYMILYEIQFKEDDSSVFNYPVLKKEQGEEYYKVIGCCKMIREEYLLFNCNLPKQTILIQ